MTVAAIKGLASAFFQPARYPCRGGAADRCTGFLGAIHGNMRARKHGISVACHHGTTVARPAPIRDATGTARNTFLKASRGDESAACSDVAWPVKPPLCAA